MEAKKKQKGKAGKAANAAKTGKIVIAVIVLAAVVFNGCMAVFFNDIAKKFSKTTMKNVDRAYTLAEGTQVATQLEEEGATLLYNEDGTLPLSGSKVTILGACSHNYVQGGTGSAGGRDDSNTAMMDKAFDNAGIDYNKEAWTWLDNALGDGIDTHNGSVNAEYLASGDPATEFSWTDYSQVHEFTIDTYEEFVTGDVIGEYDDVAVVTFGRSGAEGASPSLDYDGNMDTTTGRCYLELTDDEKDLLEFCAQHFEKTVVLVNSAEPMECGFVNNEAYNVSAVLWIGHPGEAGMYGVANILSGAVNPSGRVVDTWTYDMSTNPTFYSANDQTYSNVSMQSKNKYYQYNEGIYVGYRYYETADAAGYFDSEEFADTKFKGNISSGKYYSDLDVNGSYEEQREAGPQATYSGYDEVVQFPFGYGLSYTTFSQEITSSDVKLESHGENSVTVNVTNTGGVAGKSVVQLYMEAPYNQDSSLGIEGVGLEKAQVVLMGFGKTQILQPGESEEVTIEFSTDSLATFDQFGQGCYVLEGGEYIFHVSPNAHGWANEEEYGADYDSVSATLASTLIYSEDGEGARVMTANGVTSTEGTVAVNAMNDITAGDGAMLINGGASGTYDLGYLSRSDFHAGMVEIMSYQSDDYVGKYSGNGYVWSADGKGTTPVVTGATAGRRDAADAVATAIETTPQSLEGTDGISEGMEYDYGSILADGVSFGDGGTSKTLYGYGNDSYINEKYTRDGLPTSDESYLTADSGLTIEWEAEYYVALDSDGETVKDSDGYVKIYDSESDAGADGTATLLQCEHMANVPSDDVRWDKLANMLSFKEADDLMGENGWHCYAAESVGKEFALAVDGPGEAGNAQNADCTWWPCAVIIAATWNVDLAEQEGVAYGHQDLLNNTPYCYAPAMNIHRTPFGGRDFEYYSEDGFISGMIGGHVVQGLQSTGMHVFIKHYALNDSDTNRGGVNTWADEMSIREIYAKPYEICCKFFDADGIMGSLNSMGMAWAHSGFYQTMTRDEWGWHGMLITDGDGSASDVYNNYSFWTIGAEGGILGSGDLSANTAYTTIGTDGSGATNYAKFMIHNIGRNALYQYSHNIDKLNAVTTTTVNTTVPIIIIVAVDVILLLAAVITAVVTLRPGKNKAAALAMALTLSSAVMVSLTGCGDSATAPKSLTFNTEDGTFVFDAVKDADTYTVGVCKVLNDTTGEALLGINGATLTEVADGKSYYLWSEQSGSASGVADTDGDGKVDGSITFREYSSSASTVGAVMKMEDLAPGHYVLQAMANSNSELTDPQTAYYEFVIGGTLAEPVGFTAAVNDGGYMEVTAPSGYYLSCLTGTGMPTRMKFEVKENGEIVDSFELDDFSYTNSVNGPNKSFSFNNNTYAGTAKLDSAKDYTVTVTAVGDGDTIKDASADAYMATKTEALEFAATYDTKGSATAGDMTVAVTLGKNAAGEDVYELTGSMNETVVLRESGTYKASADAVTEEDANTYPDGTTITFTTDATDADEKVLDGVTAKVEKSEGGMGGFPGGPGGGSSSSNYNLIADGLSLNGEAFDLAASSGMGGFPGGPMGPG